MTTKDDIISSLKERIAKFEHTAKEEQIGTVISVGDGIARLSGLSNVAASEMLEFPGGTYGVALNLEEDEVGTIVLGDTSKIKEGDTVKALGRILSVPVSGSVLGRVVNPLGEPVDGKGEIKAEKYLPVERIAPGVMTRKSVGVPLQTLPRRPARRQMLQLLLTGPYGAQGHFDGLRWKRDAYKQEQSRQQDQAWRLVR